MTEGRYPAISKAESAFIYLLLATLSGALSPVLYDLTGGNVSGYEDSNPYRFLLLLTLYSIALALALYRYAATKALVRTALLVTASFLLPLVSVIWSVDPITTVKRATAYFLTGVSCFYICSTISLDNLYKRLIILFFFAAIMSFVYALAVPANGTHIAGILAGAWRGVYGHKNDLGPACTLAIIIASLYAPKSGLMSAIRWATIAMSLVLVYLAQSKTNWLAIGMWICFLPILFFLRQQRIPKSIRYALVIVPSIVGIILVTQFSEVLLEAVGRDSSMSGRTTLWRGVMTVVSEKFPLLGAGYGAFFTTNGGVDAISDYLRFWSIRPNHAHSGYIQVFADLGWLGEAILFSIIFISGARIFSLVSQAGGDGKWLTAASLFMVFLVNNYSESLSFKHSNLEWFIFIALFIYSSEYFRRSSVSKVEGPPLLLANPRSLALR